MRHEQVTTCVFCDLHWWQLQGGGRLAEPPPLEGVDLGVDFPSGVTNGDAAGSLTGVVAFLGAGALFAVRSSSKRSVSLNGRALPALDERVTMLVGGKPAGPEPRFRVLDSKASFWESLVGIRVCAEEMGVAGVEEVVEEAEEEEEEDVFEGILNLICNLGLRWLLFSECETRVLMDSMDSIDSVFSGIGMDASGVGDSNGIAHPLGWGLRLFVFVGGTKILKELSVKIGDPLGEPKLSW